jgi:hypothetical protein
VKTKGRAKPVYLLAEKGFALLRDDPDHPASGAWREPKLNSAPHVVHDLERNEWLFSFRSLAPRRLVRFWGPRSGRIKVPSVWDRHAEERRLRSTDLGGLRSPIDLVRDEFSNIVPDLTLELRLERPEGTEARTDLLVESEWGNNNETVWNKALAYDGLVNGWWQEHPRYKAFRRPPTVVFAVPDLPRASRFLAIFDEALRGYLIDPPHTQTRAENEQGIVPKAGKIYLGRQNIYVAVARDVHQRTLRAWRVPAKPPDERVRDAPNADERRLAATPIPRQSVLLNLRDLMDAAT